MEAMDYLLKPVDKTRLAETIDRARQSAQERKAASPCLGLRSSYQLRMDDKKQTEVPVSRVQTKRLRELLKL
jgi:DNA-binding LytR/AlgR family response regulator